MSNNNQLAKISGESLLDPETNDLSKLSSKFGEENLDAWFGSMSQEKEEIALQ